MTKEEDWMHGADAPSAFSDPVAFERIRPLFPIAAALWVVAVVWLFWSSEFHRLFSPSLEVCKPRQVFRKLIVAQCGAMVFS
jgi:hypothetical protein